jgi:hypothetical protein
MMDAVRPATSERVEVAMDTGDGTPSLAALPFTLRRSSDVVGSMEIATTRETVHGLLRFSGEGLAVQWRRSFSTDRIGNEIRTDREIEEVRELFLPIRGLAGAAVRWIWRRWPPGRYLVITAADLRAFEGLAGLSGLQLDHPAELVLRIDRGQSLQAREFAGEIELALAERALREADSTHEVAEAKGSPRLTNPGVQPQATRSEAAPARGTTPMPTQQRQQGSQPQPKPMPPDV